MKKTTPKKSFTITEAAKKLGVSRQAVHAGIKSGRLPAKWGKRITKILLISEKDLKAFSIDPEQKARGKKRLT